MANSSNTRIALIQHGYNVLAIVDGNDLELLAAECKSNGVETMDYELDYKRPFTSAELDALPFNPANFIRNIADGECYVTTDENLISEYIND